jgi:hypothetical protein
VRTCTAAPFVLRSNSGSFRSSIRGLLQGQSCSCLNLPQQGLKNQLNFSKFRGGWFFKNWYCEKIGTVYVKNRYHCKKNGTIHLKFGEKNLKSIRSKFCWPAKFLDNGHNWTNVSSIGQQTSLRTSWDLTNHESRIIVSPRLRVTFSPFFESKSKQSDMPHCTSCALDRWTWCLELVQSFNWETVSENTSILWNPDPIQ